jgi:hypothetical protein
MTKGKCSALVVMLLVLLLMASVAIAQETTGGLQGTVKDPTGAVVSKALVEVSGPALIGTKKVETDSVGNYRFSNLPPGEYTITVTAQNFKTLRQEHVKLNAGALPTIELKLEIGQTSQVVEVSSLAPIVDVTTSKVETEVTEEVLAAMPKGRSFQSVIPFAPGARQEPLASSRTDQGRVNGFQIDGASDAENVYMQEGLNTTAIYGGGVGANVPFEFVQEVQVKSSSFEAEFGGATGGVVNVVSKRGGPAWHGNVFTYYSGDKLDANNQCVTRGYNTINATCGLRLTPGTSLNSGTAASTWTDRKDGVPQYYAQKQDQYSVVEPGFSISGPLLTNRLWLFTSYVPTLSNTTRTVNFTGLNPGPHSFTYHDVTHSSDLRLDYRLTNSVRLFGSWQGGYRRVSGINLPATPDSLTAQKNNAAGTDPNTLRSDTGTVNPLTVLNFGGDWTVNAKTVVTARYGQFYYDTQDRGRPTGTRYFWETDTTAPVSVLGAGNVLLPASAQHTAGYANIPGNQQQIFDVFSRRQFSSDISYTTNFFGTHSLKSGYSVSRTAENTAQGYNTSLVLIYYGQSYSPLTSATACNAVITANGACRGTYGYYILQDGVNTNGNVSALNHSLYFQDAWTIKGLTVNGGVRFDKEFLPPYSAAGSSINFGFTDKVAPRIGVAYDVLHNGKLKAFASYGKFFDIMKYSLPRGSFGGDRWHDCAYTLDTTNYTSIIPTNVAGKFCPDSGPASGSLPGTFIENQNWRASLGADPRDPIVDPNIKPMQTHEVVAGADWAISPMLGLETRFSHKALDQTIEDMSLDDGQFYIGNPGSPFSQVLQRTLYTEGFTAPICPACPPQPKATRVYNGLEFRLTKRYANNWYGEVSYTYSRLTGNYPGLSSSYITDGNGGRHEPNNNRSFDEPQMQYDAHGNVIGGPLPTDRPHSVSGLVYYTLKWFGQETSFALQQQISSGTPQSTCLPTVDTASSCQFVEGQGSWLNLHQDPTTGAIVLDSITHNKRSPAYLQSDLSINHEIKVSKSNEALRLALNLNVTNLLNQHSVVALQNNPLAGAVFATPTTNANSLGYDYKAMETGWNYMAIMNDTTRVFNAGTGNWQYAGANASQSPATLAARYGLPIMYQNSRTLRLQIKFAF